MKKSAKISSCWSGDQTVAAENQVTGERLHSNKFAVGQETRQGRQKNLLLVGSPGSGEKIAVGWETTRWRQKLGGSGF
jgi:allantoicase